ncbi:LOW QUALITY PROTEIN: hypothetical protein OSB04_002241 [Centaurea solstitialis]|uniref:Uncharacterized protein n=1 Tax=Centaurea solstitialis TaxID=347529 RepID=A0AA38U4A5_9ASTR|nr:LOW QUALITY PROTEIN: hypothetical protein OSB04_002241 [Centaurea solstitialis]
MNTCRDLFTDRHIPLDFRRSYPPFANKDFGTLPINALFDKSIRISLNDDKFVGITLESFLPDEFNLGLDRRLTGNWPKIEFPARFISITETHKPKMGINGFDSTRYVQKWEVFGILMLENKYTEGLPESYANCSPLVRLKVSNNSLSDRVEVRPNIGEAKSLQQLFLANNRFCDELSEEISEISYLLMSNRFTDEFPTRIGDLKKLNNLRLESNYSGVSFGLCVSVIDINLAGNSISGQFPVSLRSKPSLNSSGNKLSSVIPTSLSSLRLILIDLSNNTLIGRVLKSLLAEAYEGSFAENPGDLCTCSLGSWKSSDLDVFIAGGLLLLLSLACFLFVKLRRKISSLGSVEVFLWDMKHCHVISINEGEILLIDVTKIGGQAGVRRHDGGITDDGIYGFKCRDVGVKISSDNPAFFFLNSQLPGNDNTSQPPVNDPSLNFFSHLYSSSRLRLDYILGNLEMNIRPSKTKPGHKMCTRGFEPGANGIPSTSPTGHTATS